MKIKIEKKETILEKVAVKFPIYSKIEEDHVITYVKITKDMFYQIRINDNGAYLSKFKTNNRIISDLWWSNKSNWKEFQEAIRYCKKYFNGF